MKQWKEWLIEEKYQALLDECEEMKMLYTVAEYANMLNVKKAEIYKRIDTDLKEMAIKNNGVWYIETDRIGQTEATEEQTNDSKKQKQTAEEDNKLKEAQKEIERLREQLTQEQEHNRESEKRLLDMMEKVIKLTENTQILMARTQEQQLLLSDGQEKQRKGLFSWLKRKKQREYRKDIHAISYILKQVFILIEERSRFLLLFLF